ncbi:MAG TPA: hypothetical protein DDX92_10690 [Flavobacteriales bacterium]|jgi:hypothetical protein|nr:hypothetical protein [Flavobacteriales bacterium]
MKKGVLILLMGLLTQAVSGLFVVKNFGEDPELHLVDYQVFKRGERMEYLVHYGWIDAGKAIVEVQNEDMEYQGRTMLHIKGWGRSKGAFDFFYKVRDYYETVMDPDSMVPYHFVRDINEGGFKFRKEYNFDRENQRVVTHNGEIIKVPGGVQDLLSSYYFARHIDLDSYQIGDVISFKAIVDEKVEPLRIRYLGKEKVKIKTGTYRCHKFQPLVQEGRIFDDPEDLTVYISDDKNKVPVLMKADVLVGSIKMELISWEGLLHDLARE